MRTRRGRLDALPAWIVLAGWMLACGGGSPPDPAMTFVDIAATANFTGTQFVVTNTGSLAWSDVKLEVNSTGMFSSGFLYDVPTIPAGESIRVGALNFAKPDGTRFNPVQFKPQKLSITVRLPDGTTGLYVGSW